MEGLKMNTRSFSKGIPVRYQWISILLLIVFLCFASIYNSYAAALLPSDAEQHDKSIEAGNYDFPDIISPSPKKLTEK